ncbi:hypothetical protein B0H16DRAFT_1451427 [Mycena metata]|uniref:Uncharacterized protein n=1 Tax=Mycena metata TaxID=1033252 RepID=A0AAD7JUX4_9AGAR|nr:hypothetical protein B0H16DRAFT_1451427 [Mycena metata]
MYSTWNAGSFATKAREFDTTPEFERIAARVRPSQLAKHIGCAPIHVPARSKSRTSAACWRLVSVRAEKSFGEGSVEHHAERGMWGTSTKFWGRQCRTPTGKKHHSGHVIEVVQEVQSQKSCQAETSVFVVAFNLRFLYSSRPPHIPSPHREYIDDLFSLVHIALFWTMIQLYYFRTGKWGHISGRSSDLEGQTACIALCN